MTPLEQLGVRLGRFPCPLCGQDDFEALADCDRHELGVQTVGCRSCGLVQTSPRPDADSLSQFYADHYRQFYQQVTTPSQQYLADYGKQHRLRYTASHLLQALDLQSRPRLLDYGCGEGSLFIALRQAGFAGELFGVEPNAAFARYAAEQGQAMVSRSMADLPPVDVVTINHVLEHLADPIAVLAEIARQLLPAGRIYIDVPDVERYRGVEDLHIAHLWHFSPRTLVALVESAGLTVLGCECHSPPHHPASIRLLAAPGPAAGARQALTAASEPAGWPRIRAIGRRAWRWRLRRRLAGVPPLRWLARCWRRLWAPAETGDGR